MVISISSSTFTPDSVGRFKDIRDWWKRLTLASALYGAGFLYCPLLVSRFDE